LPKKIAPDQRVMLGREEGERRRKKEVEPMRTFHLGGGGNV